MIGASIKAILAIIVSFYTAFTLLIASPLIAKPVDVPVVATKDDVPKDATPASITMLLNDQDVAYKIQQIYDIYSQSGHDTLPISVRTIAHSADYKSQLRAAYVSDSMPDVVCLGGAKDVLEFKSKLRPVGAEWTADIGANLLDSVTIDSAVYGIPYSVEAVGLICNRDIFAEAEINLDDINSFEELSDALKDLDEQRQLGENEILAQLECVTDLPIGDKSFIAGTLSNIVTTTAFESGLQCALAERLTLPVSADAENFVKLMAQYAAGGAAWSKLLNSIDDTQLARFANEKTAVILSDTAAYKKINALNPKLTGKTYLLPIPLDTLEDPQIFVSAPFYWAFSALSDPVVATSADNFFTWLYTDEVGIKCFADNFEAVSPIFSTQQPPKAVVQAQMLGYIKNGIVAPNISRDYPDNWGTGVFAEEIQKYFENREQTWESSMKACIDSWSKMRLE